jgi:hypothetical protein
MNFTKLDDLAEQTEKELKDAQQIADEILKLEPPTEVEEIVLNIQLLLQYRLNCQDALHVLAQLDRHLLSILGIEARHSAAINFERMSYALGSLDLKQILNALSLLVQSLLKVAARYQHEKTASFQDKAAKSPKKTRVCSQLYELNTKQSWTVKLLNKMLVELTLIKYEAIGPVYDHIAALQGPVSRFYQAIQHGLAVSLQLYERFSKNHTLVQELEPLLNKTNELLLNLSRVMQPKPSSLGYFKEKSHEQLEERAAAKRLRPFFSPYK